jgi:hypothetical protein
MNELDTAVTALINATRNPWNPWDSEAAHRAVTAAAYTLMHDKGMTVGHGGPTEEDAAREMQARATASAAVAHLMIERAIAAGDTENLTERVATQIARVARVFWDWEDNLTIDQTIFTYDGPLWPMTLIL